METTLTLFGVIEIHATGFWAWPLSALAAIVLALLVCLIVWALWAAVELAALIASWLGRRFHHHHH